MRWTAPPDKRELVLVFLSLTVYLFAYNLDTSLNLLGLDPVATQGVILRQFGLGKTQAIGKDGRKPPGWRDSLEADIFGDWGWDEGHVAGSGKERSQPLVTGRHGATWTERQRVETPGAVQPEDPSVDDALQRWGEDDFPQTRLVQHVPGYTILDNVFLFNNTVCLITDSGHLLPPMHNMVASVGNGFAAWQVLSLQEGRRLVGSYGATIRGVSWMSADPNPHNSTLFALWRTYSSLDASIDSAGRTTLAPPHRLVFPHNRFFTDANPPFDDHWIRRTRADTGIHPYLAKAAFPQLTFQYFEDWDDYRHLEVPFVYERLVIADRRAAEASIESGMPVYSSAFTLAGSQNWWEPIRKNLAMYLGEYDIKPKAKRGVTYVHTQDEAHGPKLSDDDHKNLLQALKSAGRRYGYELHVVSTQTNYTTWSEKMTSVVKSSIIIGVYGHHLMDSVFMRPNQSTLIELFPTNRFVRDQEFAVHSLGMHYMAWSGNQLFASDLPPVSHPQDQGEPIPINVRVIAEAVHTALSRVS